MCKRKAWKEQLKEAKRAWKDLEPEAKEQQVERPKSVCKNSDKQVSIDAKKEVSNQRSPILLNHQDPVHPLSGKSYGESAGTTLAFVFKRLPFFNLFRGKTTCKNIFPQNFDFKKINFWNLKYAVGEECLFIHWHHVPLLQNHHRVYQPSLLSLWRSNPQRFVGWVLCSGDRFLKNHHKFLIQIHAN